VRVILVNSNPASIMTDPEIADRTYVEPLHPDYVAAILERERPRAILPTVGGQTALNLALALHEGGFSSATTSSSSAPASTPSRRAESRELFDATMRRAGLLPARGGMARSLRDAEAILDEVGLPVIVRPSFTLGGSGGGTATHTRAFQALVQDALRQSPVGEVRVEECLVGWKEFELEVIRDRNDNASSSARSRTSIRWACTPATASPWRRR
jgi:carbamoyl-phosphate synthase large subunit